MMQSRIFRFLSALRLRWKFSLVIVSIILVIGAFFTITIMTTMTQALRNELVKKGHAIIKNLAADSNEPLLTDNLIKLQNLVNNVKSTEPDVAYAYISDSKGSVLVHTFGDGFPKGLAEIHILLPGQAYHNQMLDTEQGYIHDLAIPVLAGEAGCVHVGINEVHIRKTITNTTQVLIGMTIGGAILGIFSAFFLSFIMVRPLEQLEKGAIEIGKGKLDQRLPIKTKDEIGGLASTFNKMAENLQELIASRDQQNSFMNTVLDSLTHPFYVINVNDHTIKIANSAARSAELSERTTCYALTHQRNEPCNGSEYSCPLELVKQTKEPVKIEHLHLDEKGNARNIEVHAYPIFDPDGNLIQVIEYNFDITDRKQAEDALSAEKEQLAVTLRSIGDGVITTDILGNIILINKIAENLTGWSQDEARGKPLEEVFNITNRETRAPRKNPVKRVLELGKIVGLADHTVLTSRDGIERVIADSGAPIRDKDSKIIGVVLVFRDITEKVQMESELLKIEKLESVGILAGGIAHDFNNILMAILGNLNLASQYVNKNDKVFPLLVDAEKASVRAKNLTQQLLTFSKGGDPVKEAALIQEIIKDSADFVLHGGKVACEYHMPDTLWLVKIDKGQMSQVIQNLIINARHPMPKGGVINITCENINTIATEDIYFLHKENYVKVTISDTGIGIPANVIDKIFDPYFTTKQEGSGLGLAIIHSIISKHDGHISIRSEPGVGTTFTIYLPAAFKKQQRKETEAEALEPVNGGIKVMIMDDEEMVRSVAEKMLTHLSYEVVLAKDGTEAIELYRKLYDSTKPVDVVIMDLTIPGGVGGEDAVKDILAINPEARVIVSSGYSTDPIMANYQEYGFSACVTKPYKMQELIKGINKVLL